MKSMSVHIDAPVEKVFAAFKDPVALADIAVMPTEMFDVKETRQGTGTIYSWRTKIAGITLEGFDVFTDVVANKHITEKSSNAFVGTWEYDFEPDGKGTKLTMSHHGRSIWGLPPIDYLVGLAQSRMMATLMPRMKERLEAPKPKAGKAA